MQKTADILRLLSKHGVEFVVVGGYAVVAHGGTMVTQDIDVCCNFSPENLLRIQDALKDHHPVHRMTPKRLPLQLTKENCQGLKNIYLDTDMQPDFPDSPDSWRVGLRADRLSSVFRLLSSIFLKSHSAIGSYPHARQSRRERRLT